MALLNKKLAASSLVEVTVGMVLISMVIGFALLIYTNVSRSTHSLQEVKCQLQLEMIARETIREQAFYPQIWQDEVVTVRQQVSPYPATEGAWLIQLTAFRADQTVLATYQTIAYAPPR